MALYLYDYDVTIALVITPIYTSVHKRVTSDCAFSDIYASYCEIGVFFCCSTASLHSIYIRLTVLNIIRIV